MNCEMEKDICTVGQLKVPIQIKEFAEQLPEEQRTKCMSLFSCSAPNLPLPAELDIFSETLGVLEKLAFWKAISLVQAQSTTCAPLVCLPTSEIVNSSINQKPAFEEVGNLSPAANNVIAKPSSTSDAIIPKNKWELSFVAPIIDEEGVPSRQFFSQLMKEEKADMKQEKKKTIFSRSTDVRCEVARKSIENGSFQNDKCLDEDQKVVITELKRVWGKERERVACNKRFCLSDSCIGGVLYFSLMAGVAISIVGGLLFISERVPIGVNIALIVFGAITIIVCTVLMICTCCPIELSSLGVERDLASQGFWDDLRESMKPCVRQRVKNWRRKKEWRWLLSEDERNEEEKIDKEEEERKRKEKMEQLSRKAEIEMERMMKIQNEAGSDGGARNIQTTCIYGTVAVVNAEKGIINKDEE
ncbi:uncharacterized protein MONOS_12296 [Monocercomonoides exilis]|uniref:uncharacterized protein n=1 Tax=Monocercomonoides exilis TaxID=2049356 RepID=UPI00355A54BA|nr:hypothetical protein MONOS_12296 [Monocercomonoides exilis]|eukprot:MONOS_12296.1-p1 / transcript=MONOS_12296.1 / gene=MONOS_12296 / organism=Monocercomonoides_exilis_PA203 / gene_product=unspecified product / transcript_product=unspecified product / location=Mono_scaffold00672:10204-11451(-) / protein_length=416 / sequence_SO=supercontig / SO=protein_coding / is_pseudo=false